MWKFKTESVLGKKLSIQIWKQRSPSEYNGGGDDPKKPEGWLSYRWAYLQVDTVYCSGLVMSKEKIMKEPYKEEWRAQEEMRVWGSHVWLWWQRSETFKEQKAI